MTKGIRVIMNRLRAKLKVTMIYEREDELQRVCIYILGRAIPEE